MDPLYIPATKETPEVRFVFSENRLEVIGESYPENAMAFYAPLRASLQDYLASPLAQNATTEAVFSLRYFNSASTKLIRAMFAMLHKAAEAGHAVVARWHHDPDDDMMAEFGMDLKEEFSEIRFELIPQSIAS